jgi:hypothetical protein
VRGREVHADAVYAKAFVEEMTVGVEIVKRRGGEIISRDVIGVFRNGLDKGNSSARWCCGRHLRSLGRCPAVMFLGVIKGWAGTLTH